MRVVYIAGAFRAPTAWGVQQNVRAAETAGLEVAKLGACPLIPHKNSENFHGIFSDEFWLEATQELLRRCDAVFVHDPTHAETSEGTLCEIAVAEARGMPVFYELFRLRRWLEEK